MFAIGRFQPHECAQAMGIVAEASSPPERFVQRLLPGMPEWPVTDVVGECESFREVFVEA